jgi:Holliday junction resolvase RusA-like endonuclease
MTETTKRVTFHQNPFYHHLFGSLNMLVPSKRVGYKLKPDGTPGRARIPKGAQDFEVLLKDILTAYGEKRWPYKQRLLIAIEIHFTEREYRTKDVDNVAKTLLDAMKGVVFEDDAQVDLLQVSKLSSSQNSFMIGVRRLADDEHLSCFPPLLKEGERFSEVQTYRVVAKFEK